LEAFAAGKEEKLLETLFDKMDTFDKKNILYLKPEWYRKTKLSKCEDVFEEYGYVLRNSKLFVYHYGKRLFETKREDAKIWLYLVENLSGIIDQCLYSKEILNYKWENYHKLFHFLEKK